MYVRSCVCVCVCVCVCDEGSARRKKQRMYYDQKKVKKRKNGGGTAGGSFGRWKPGPPRCEPCKVTSAIQKKRPPIGGGEDKEKPSGPFFCPKQEKISLLSTQSSPITT